MKFGVFFEIQTPEPFTRESEYSALWEEVKQIELAEKLGFDYAWSCEHHSLGIRAHCSAPEVYLAAISQRTSTIRLGHAVIEMAPPINHVIRVAERVATLDILSHGRVDAGLGRTHLREDLRPFGVNEEDVHEMWREGVTAIRKLWTEDPVSFHGKYYDIPSCSIVPKPYQRPYPPLWNAILKDPAFWRETACLGMGVLTTSFTFNDEGVRAYREAILQPDPDAQVVNNQVGVMIHVFCHKDDKVGITRGVKGEQWVQDRLYSPGYVHPAGTPRERVDNGTLAFGDPQRVIDILKKYEDRGTDQILCWFRFGMLPNDEVTEGIELFAAEVMPRLR